MAYRHDINLVKIMAGCLFILLSTIPANAAVITNPSQLAPNFKIIDFEDISDSTVTPFTVSGVTFDSLTAAGFIFDVSAWPANGTEIYRRTLFPGGEPDSAISIVFSKPVSQVLLGWGDPNFAGNILRAYDAAGNLLEEGPVALGPINGIHAAWIGFKRPVADIAKIIVQPDQSQPFGDDYVIDNVHFNDAQPFARMSTRFQGEIQENGVSSFQANTSFALGKASDGINPLTEHVMIAIGTASFSITPGSFVRNKQGSFTFRGMLDGADVAVTLKPSKGGYDLALSVSGADLSESTLPLVVGLAIGDDAGSAAMTNLNATSD